MFAAVSWPFETSGFLPRGRNGEWENEPWLMWLHIGGDLFSWLAFLSIPFVLLYGLRRRELPGTWHVLLLGFAFFTSAFEHFIDALVFQAPIYRLAGLWKVATAVALWGVIFALIPRMSRPTPPGFSIVNQTTLGDTTLHRLTALPTRGRVREYIIGILAGVLALLLRAAIDPIVTTDHEYVVSLLAVVFVSWQCGLGPGIVTLAVSMIGMVYFFISPRQSFLIEQFGDHLSTALFFFCGVCCAALGEAQRIARRRAKSALAIALERKAELESEIARRRVTEDALRQSEATLRAFYDSAPIYMGIVEPLENDVLHIYDNSASCRFFGIEVGSTAGRRATTLGTPPEGITLWLSKYRECIASSAAVQFEYAYTATDGRRWLLATVSPIGTSVDGRRLCCYVAEDVTMRRQAETAIRVSESRFRSMADSIPSLIWVAEGDTRRNYFNRTWLEFTGRTIDQELGYGWAENIHPGDRERYLNTYSDAFAKRRPFEIEYLLRRHDGTYRWVLARGTPWMNPASDEPGMVGLCLDVTDRRMAEDAVRRSESRYRTLTDAIPQIVWNARTNGELTFVNRRWAEFTGQPLESINTDVWANVVHPDDREQLRADWQLAIANEPETFSEEFRLRRASDGSYRWVLSVAVPIRDGTGPLQEWVGSITDIDDQKRQAETLERMVRERTAALVEEIEERKRAEHQVRSVAAELVRSNSELEQFAYIASHDLQEPLRKIQAFGDRLQTRYRDELPAAGQEYVDRMLTSASRMRRLIDDLLSFSRVTTLTRSFRPVNLTSLVSEVVGELDDHVEQVGAIVQVGELPTVEADPSQMRQLFQNLIANGLKFHQPGEPPVVEITGELSPQPLIGPTGQPVAACQITVRDHGIGFDEKYLDRIFQVFQRLHGRNEYEGTGVGLAICRKIAERHGGTITARSQPGEGAAFTITLPVRQSREEYTADVHTNQETNYDPDGG